MLLSTKILRRRLPLAAVLVATACAAPAVEHRALRNSETRGPDPPPMPWTTSARAQGAAPAIDADSTLEDLLRHAERASPILVTARERWKAAEERILQADSYPDPRLATKIFATPVETRVGPQRFGASLTQRLPWFGKRGRAAAAAAALARAEEARYAGAHAALVAEVRDAWYELYFLERALESVQRNQEILANTEEVVRARYAAGEAAYADLLRSQVELGRLDDRRRGFEDRRRPVRARLNAALHRAPAAPLPTPLAIPEPDDLPADEELFAELEAVNPDLAALRHLVEARRYGVELAGFARRPEVTVGVEYIVTGDARMDGVDGSGDDPIAALLSLNLPVHGKRNAAEEREARAYERAARATLASETDRLRYRLDEELFAHREATRKLELYENTLLPRIHQSLEAVATSFRAGDSDLLDVLDVDRTHLEFELEVERARTERARSEVRIDHLLGRVLPSEESR